MSSAHRHLSERQIARSILASGRREAGGAEEAKAARDAGHANDAAALCPLCSARLDEAAQLSQHFHRAVLPRTLPCLHLRAEMAGGWPGARLWRRCRAVTRLAPAMVPAMAVAALLLFLRPHLASVESGASDARLAGQVLADGHTLSELMPGLTPELMIKGPLDPFPARLFVRRGDGAERLDDGALVHPGDALAFVVDPGRRGYALVVSIDGAQRISTYSPYEGAASAPVPFSVLPVVLEPSIILDDTLGSERIWLLLSDAPLATRELQPALARLAFAGSAAVRAASADALFEGAAIGEGVVAISWLIHKVPR